MSPKHTDFNRLTPDDGSFAKGFSYGVIISIVLWGIIWSILT